MPTSEFEGGNCVHEHMPETAYNMFQAGVFLCRFLHQVQSLYKALPIGFEWQQYMSIHSVAKRILVCNDSWDLGPIPNLQSWSGA